MEDDIKIRIIIADDNKAICDLYNNYLKDYNRIEILAIANTDEEEIQAIQKYKPEIVITDLVRNGRYTGLEIIKDYAEVEDRPEFLVISADRKQEVIPPDLFIAGYIKKPFTDYSVIVEELYKIKSYILKNKKENAIKKSMEKAAKRTIFKKNNILKFRKK